MTPFDNEFLKECRNVTEKYDKIMGTWSIDSGILHIHSELSEVKDVLRNKNHKYGYGLEHQFKLLDELADVFLTTISLVNILGIVDQDLNTALQKKLEVVKKRVAVIEAQQTFQKVEDKK